MDEAFADIQITAKAKAPRKPDLDDAVPDRGESGLFFDQYRSFGDGDTLFSAHNLLVACTLFALDFPDDIPEDLYDEAIAENPPISGKLIDELYTDLLEARAHDRTHATEIRRGKLKPMFSKLIADIREFVEEGR